MRPKSVHIVDWATLQLIRHELCRRISPGNDPTATAEDVTQSWLRVAEAEQQRHSCGPLGERDKDFIEIRVLQSMREVDPQGSGQVDIDVWVHHMLLTRSSPPAMRAMLQINRLLEAALELCPGILVLLQHAFEVAARDREDLPEPATAASSSRLTCSEVVGIYGRKLWHLRPGARGAPLKCHSDFAHSTPDEFIRNIAAALELDSVGRVTSADFLALGLGRREWQVSLNLYDISRGAAKVLAPWLINQTVEGIWHSGIVVFGKEYYFGGDIYYDTPAETGFGTPRRSIYLGNTLRQKDELHSFIVEELKPIFTKEAYDALSTNCNHFTDKVAMYLIGKHIPEEVLDQPMLLRTTAVGRMLRPMLNRTLGETFTPNATAGEVSFSHRASGPLLTWDKGDLLAEDPSGVADGEPWGKAVAL